MRKCLFLSAVVAVSALLSPSSARASGVTPPYVTTALFSAYNQGWQSNLYWYHWHYPWYAYYNYSHGPYANWWMGGGWATYANCVGGPCGGGWYHGGAGHFGQAGPGATAEATVTITLPPDAKLLFNGVAATGTGAIRSFRTPPLVVGQTYSYELTAEVVRDGKTVTATEKVMIRGGDKATVTLTPQ